MQNSFDQASVQLLQNIVDRLEQNIVGRLDSLEQRSVRIETRLCRFIETDGKEEVLSPRPEPTTADA